MFASSAVLAGRFSHGLMSGRSIDVAWRVDEMAYYLNVIMNIDESELSGYNNNQLHFLYSAVSLRAQHTSQKRNRLIKKS